MALSTFAEKFSSTYQVVFQKVLVAMKVASTQFEGELSYGKTLRRVRYLIDSVPVRDLNISADYTIDETSDTSELITIDKNRGLQFHLSDVEKVQAGPLSPGQVIGSGMAKKVARYVDGDVFNEVRNAFAAFDTGNLTTATSNGTPITLTTANVPNFVAQTQARLRVNNIDVDSGTCFVVDPYLHSIVVQYLLNKNNDMSVGQFANGYAGEYMGSEVYVSNNLSSDIVMTWATNPTAAQTLTINGTVFTFVAALTATAGQVLIGATRDLTAANLVQAVNALTLRINTPGTTPAGSGSAYVEFTGTALNAAADLRMTASDVTATDITTIASIGGGRLSAASTVTGATFANVLHVFFGKKGSIELVVQKDVKAQMIENPFRYGQIIRSKALYGIKTFYDSAQQFLDVKIAF